MSEQITSKTAVSSMKIAAALAFMGAASLLAASSVLRPDTSKQVNKVPPISIKFDLPDLIITKTVVRMEKYSGYGDLELMVQYQNIGKTVVGKPFQIVITTEPAGLFGEGGVAAGQANKPSEKKSDENKYNLAPGETAAMKIALKRNEGVDLDVEADSVRILGYVDYLQNTPGGNVPELNEKNNQSSLIVPVEVITFVNY